MENRTHNTAIVIIPPEDVWRPIQAIRQKHDRKLRRWMPHITLIYPFRPQSEFERAAEELAPVCRTIQPFDVELVTFRIFEHGKGYYTVWLAPEPEEPLLDLHAAVWTAVSRQDEFAPVIGRFKPHLSVGQARGTASMVKLVDELQADWTPVRFAVSAVHLIWRGNGRDDAFRIAKSLPLDER
ncbi:hypothetical protein LCGC14_1479650 [marine sediment metagenome]|uniref:Phosphoesterase HXTX domain-containing protein n=1 Tax=marine sediment metagenome TaxID=412755 RepID=A0A0F9JAI4_9ZZZZ